MRNKYICEARISERKFRELATMFCADVPALTASRLVLVNRKTSQRVYALLRKRVVEIAREEARPFTGEVEIDESYFGPRRVRGRRGRGAAGKTPVIGLLKRGGKVFTSVVVNCSRAALEPIIKGQVLSKSTVYTDGWLGYNGLLLSGYKHHRIFHHENEFARGKNHVNIDLLGKARTLFFEAGKYVELVEVLTLLGTALHRAGRSDEAQHALEEALNRARSFPTQTDLWLIHWQMAEIAADQGDKAAAVTALESALEEARRSKNEERVAATHRSLAGLLIESDSRRALAHMDAFMSSGIHPAEGEPDLVRRARAAFLDRRYEDARAGCRRGALRSCNHPDRGPGR